MRPRAAPLWRAALAVFALCAASVVHSIELTPEEAAGRRLYREGINHAGEAISARVGPQANVLGGAAVRCVNCHGADGLGRPEGGLRPPDITWRELTKPYGHRHEGGRAHPPFDLAGLARALAEGRDPGGHRLDPAMPRYVLSNRDVTALAAYLKRITEDLDPGLSAERLRIGTLLPGGGPLADSGQIVARLLRAVFEQVNAGGGVHGRRLELVVLDAGADDWAQRLDAADLFALLGPLAPGREEALQALAERSGLPVVGPLAGTGLEPVGPVFRLDAGEREQARVLAEFAARQFGAERPPLALVAEAPERGIAAAVEAQLAQHGWPRLLRAPPGQPPAGSVADWQRQGAAAVFFLGPRDDFAALLRVAAAAGWQPLFLAPASRAPAAGALSGGAGRFYLALPTLPGDGNVAGHQALDALRQRVGLPPQQPALQAAAYAGAQVLVEGLKRSGRAVSRDRLLAELEGLHGFDTGVTQPVGFGPGRRVGVNGAHVLMRDTATGRLSPVGGFLWLD